MAHIFLKANAGSGGGGFTIANVEMGSFTSEKWYMDSTLQFTNGFTDIEAGTFADPIVTYDYGSF